MTNYKSNNYRNYNFSNVLGFIEVLEDPNFDVKSNKKIVEDYFLHQLRGEWLNESYNPEDAFKILNCDDKINSASFEQIMDVITLCHRWERFNDGFWLTITNNGKFLKVLKRLEQLVKNYD